MNENIAEQKRSPDSPIVSWLNADGYAEWRFVRMQRQQWVDFPPGEEARVSVGHVVNANRLNPITIVGEESSGTGMWSHHIQESIASAEVPPAPQLVVIDCDGSAAPSPAEQLASALKVKLDVSSSSETSTSGAPSVSVSTDALTEPLSPHRPANDPKKDDQRFLTMLFDPNTYPGGRILVIIFRRLERLQLKNPDLLALLRGLLDHQRVPENLRLIFMGEDESAFFTGVFSHILQHCVVYRTPHFTLEELQNKHSGAGDNGFRFTEIAAHEALDWTGGQPLLVQICYQWLQKKHPDCLTTKEPWSPPEGAIKEAGKWLTTHPPPAVYRWQGSLARILRNSPHLAPKVKAWCRGDVNSKVVTEDRGLFVGGWLMPSRFASPTSQPKWGFSRCHQVWAREVLHDPGRFRHTEPTDGAEEGSR